MQNLKTLALNFISNSFCYQTGTTGIFFGITVDKALMPFLILLLFTQSTLAQDQWRNIYSERAWVERDQWQKAEEIIGYLKLQKGSVVADVGSHEGYMTVKLAATVGKKGKVYAVDVDQGKLDKLRKRLDERSLSQAIPTKGSYDNPNLPAEVDAVLILDAYHEMDAYEAMLGHIRKALKSGGRLVICEPIAETRQKADRKEQTRKHELAMAYALEDLHKAGFGIVFQQDPFIDREKVKGDKMWIIVAEKR